MAKLKLANSVYAKNLGNSIYQQKLSGMGLNVSGGMMINNRPDGVSGIAQAAAIKKMQKHEEKEQCISDAVAMGIAKSKGNGLIDIDLY